MCSRQTLHIDPDIQADVTHNVTHNVYLTVITLWVLPERYENVKISVTELAP